MIDNRVNKPPHLNDDTTKIIDKKATKRTQLCTVRTFSGYCVNKTVHVCCRTQLIVTVQVLHFFYIDLIIIYINRIVLNAGRDYKA